MPMLTKRYGYEPASTSAETSHNPTNLILAYKIVKTHTLVKLLPLYLIPRTGHIYPIIFVEMKMS